MMQRSLLLTRRTVSRAVVVRSFAEQASAPKASNLPETLTRIGISEVFPNEYPGQNYRFNWCLNGDGVTPLKKSAFRITKPLDLKIAGLPTGGSAKIKASGISIPEAGSPELDFEKFDSVASATKDLLSLSTTLYCPEGEMPKTRVGVRIITNAPTLAPTLLGYLDRAPRKDPVACPITVYALEGSTNEEFAGYVVEEIVDKEDVPKSVAAIVVTGKKLSANNIVAGLEASLKGLEADEAERAAKRKVEEAAAAAADGGKE